MGNDKRVSGKKIPRIKPYIVFIVTTVIIYIILSTSVAGKKYNLQAGDIAKFDIKAPKDVEDKVATQKSVEEQLKHVQDVYTYDQNVKKEAIEAVDKLFELVDTVNKQVPTTISSDDSEDVIKEKEDKQKSEKLKKLTEGSTIRNLSGDNYEALIALNASELKSLHGDIVASMNEMYDNVPIYEGNTENLITAQGSINTYFNNTSYSKDIKDLAMTIAQFQTKDTYFLDEEKTEEAKQAAIKTVSPVIYKKDQTIVTEGQPITASQIAILNDLGILDNEKATHIYLHLAIIFITAMILAMQWRYIKYKRKDIYGDGTKIVLINLLTIVFLLVSRMAVTASSYLIPFAFVSILMSVLLDDKLSVTIGVMNVIFIAIIVNFQSHIILVALLNAVLVPIIMRRVQQRNDILYSSIAIGVINILFTGLLGYFLSADITSIIKNALFTGGGALISGILAIGVLPILENVFDVVTNMKLLELSNPNHPLMRRLLLEAPGTYHHSVLVANLAEMAAERIGANPIMARVSAYYHDVGKLERPYYFKENQVGGVNPHDNLSPSVSAAIILSHVSDGVKLANRYNLPKDIIDVIREHHGDSLAKYFYITMRNNSENPDDIDEEDYRYNGPPPTTKESCIVMMADGIEASVRSIQKPDNEKIEKMVDNIIKARIDEKQLINSELTFRDIEDIKEAFLKVLKGIYHERIEYPKDKVEIEKKVEQAFLQSKNDEDVKIYSKISFRKGAR